MLRPGDPYGCSTIMAGTEGQTTLTFSNRDSPLQLNLPGRILLIFVIHQTYISNTVLGSKIYRLGTSAPRTTSVSGGLGFPSFLNTMKTDAESVNVVQKNGLVTRMIKLVKMRAVSSTDDAINVHVSST